MNDQKEQWPKPLHWCELEEEAWKELEEKLKREERQRELERQIRNESND